MNRRNFIRRLSMIGLFAVIFPQSNKANALYKCDVCHLDTPSDYMVFKAPDNSMWEDLYGPGLSVICLLCVNHRFCYPYFERIFFSKPENQVHVQDYSSPFYTSLWKDEHVCNGAIKQLYTELRNFRKSQLV